MFLLSLRNFLIVSLLHCWYTIAGFNSIDVVGWVPRTIFLRFLHPVYFTIPDVLFHSQGTHESKRILQTRKQKTQRERMKINKPKRLLFTLSLYYKSTTDRAARFQVLEKGDDEWTRRKFTYVGDSCYTC